MDWDDAASSTGDCAPSVVLVSRTRTRPMSCVIGCVPVRTLLPSRGSPEMRPLPGCLRHFVLYLEPRVMASLSRILSFLAVSGIFFISISNSLSLFLLFYYPVMFSLYSLASCSYYFFFFCSRFSRILFFPLLSSPIFSLLCSPLLSTPIFSLLARSVLPFSLFSFLFFLTSLLLSFP